MAIRSLKTVSSEQLREACGRYATGVAIACCQAAGQPVGMTINSFTSLSLDPPLILWNIGRQVPEFSAFCEAENYTIHILHEEQVALSNHFATADIDKFADIGWTATVSAGVPVLAECSVVLHCAAERVVVAGDHHILIGRVQALEHFNDKPPLLFHAGGYHRRGDDIPSGW